MNEKKWNLKTIVLYGINCVVGSGIFLLPGSAYQLMGPSSLLAYLFVLILVMSVALCFAECGSMFEQSGGPYLYAREAFGDFFGYEVGVMKWIVSIIAWATMAVGFTTALSAIFPAAADPFVNKAIAIGIITVLSIINLFGVNIMAYLNNISTIAKMIPMVIFVIGGLFFLKGSNFTPFLKDGMNMNSISAAVITVFYAFTGFENVGVAAGDMENPKKNVPKALMISMSIVSVIYFLIQFNCIGTLGTNLSGTIQHQFCKDGNGDTFWVLRERYLLHLETLVSIAGLNICGSFNTPRCAQALADGGLLPKTLSKCNRRKVPYVAVFITGMLAVLLTLTGSFTELAAISVISRFSQYIPTCLAVIALRKKSDGKKDGYRVPLGYTFPVIAILASIWLIFHTEVYKLIAGLGAMVVVAPIYFIMKKRKSAELS
ncbi:MAG: APC family permease [Coprococcus sp.]